MFYIFTDLIRYTVDNTYVSNSVIIIINNYNTISTRVPYLLTNIIIQMITHSHNSQTKYDAVWII